MCLNENDIEEFPQDAFLDLEKLEILWIYSNQITNLDENLFKNLGNLRIIDARNNLIQSLPAGLFENNPKLKVVNFSFNSLKFIEIDFRSYKGIKWIVLDGNECAKVSYCKHGECLKSLKQFQMIVAKNC